MGQTESAGASSSPRRTDPRWGRVSLEQLRDEEFLAKQLRRIETITRARQAASASGTRRHQQPPRRLFADATAARSAALTPATNGPEDRPVPWTRSLFPSDEKAAATTDEATDSADPDATGPAARKGPAKERDERCEEQLLNLLVIFGNMPHPKRTALLRCHLQDVVERACLAPDPIAELISLRRQILRSVCEASLLQQQLQNQVDMASFSFVQALMAPRTSAAKTSRSPSGTEAWKEANAAARVFADLLTLMLDPSATATPQQKKDVLVTILPFLDELHALSLTPVVSAAGSRETKKPVLDNTVSRSLIARLQSLLQHVALGGLSPSASKGTSTRPEFSLADRTIAIAALIRLAIAAGSLCQLLQVVKILLGVGDFVIESSRLLQDQQEALAEVPTSASTPMTSPSVSLLKSARARDSSATIHPPHVVNTRGDPIGVEGEKGDKSEERVDFVSEASALVDQKLKQVHKQRLDAVAKGDIDTQVTVDQLLSHAKRRTGPKGMSLKVSVSSAATTVGSTSSLAAHRVSSTIISANGSNKIKLKDDFNNVDIVGLDSLKEDGSRPSRAETTMTDNTQQVAVCPRLHPLYVGHILKELDEMKPSTVPDTQYRGRTWIALSSDLPKDCGLESPNSSIIDEREVWSCGQNSYGELGHGDTTTRKSFERIEALQRKDIIQICAGNEHSIALSADGSVWTCGYNDNGQCGLGVTTRVSHLTEVQKLGGTPIAQVHAYNGCEHTVLVTQDGRAATCGYNYRGQLGHGNTQSETVPKILRSLESKSVRLVSCSYYHTVLMCQGAGGQAIVYTFGRNDYGQLGHNDTLDRKLPQQVDALLDHRVQVVSVACGQYHTMVVTSTGRLLGFGKNDYGQLGLDTTDNQLVPVQVRGGIERQACLEVRCGYYHTIVLCAGAHLYGFGRNDYGQLGLGRASNSATVNAQLQQQRFPLPQLIEDLDGKEIVRFACGCYHTVAVSDNGVLYVFGRNNHGQLGTGDTNERLFPYPIDDFVGKRVAMVAAGFYHTLVLTGGADDNETMDDEERAPRDSSQQDDEPRDEEDGRLSATSSSSVSVLSNPTIRTYLAMAAQDVVTPSSPPTIFDGLEIGELKKKRSKFDEDSSNDPTVEADGEEGRLEVGGSGLTKQERPPPSAAAAATATQHGRSHTPKHKYPTLDPLDIASIIVAEMDRLAQPFLLSKNLQCGSVAKSSPRVIDILDVKEDDDDILIDHFPGAFVNFVVQASPTTFECLNALLLHLSSRRLDATQVTTHASSGGLQIYLMVALLRVLQANIAQLSRSGVCALIRELPPVQASGEVEGVAVRTLRRLQATLHSTREALFGLVDRRLPVEACDLVPSHRAVLMSAIDCLMTGFEVFYPCSCTQVALIDVLIRTGGGGAESPTPRMIADSTRAVASSRMSCQVCTGLWRWIPASQSTRRLLLRAVLRRMADETIMARLLHRTTLRVDPGVQSSTATPPMRAIYLPLLDRLNADFIQVLGDLSSCARSIATPLSAGPAASPITLSAGSGDTIHWLLTLQKHLTAGALGSKPWTRPWCASDTCQDFVTEIGQLIEMAFQMDPAHSVSDCPAALVDLIKYAHAVISQSMDVLNQALCREQLPSPTFGIASSSRMVAPPLFDWDARLLEAVEHSIVGKLLPALVSCLHVFARSPVVAVALVLPLKSLLSILDEFNRRRATVSAAAKEAMERLGTTLVIDAISSSSAPPAKQPGAARRPAATATTDKNANRMSLSEALALPWSLTLEKELAMVCAEMAASLVAGDPMLHVEFGDASSNDDLPKVLFCGGLHPDVVHSSILKLPSFSRTVTYAPVDVGNPDHLFSLVLPPPSTPQRFDVPGCDITSIELSTASIKLFLGAMASGAKSSPEWALKLAVVLCDWMRDQFVKKDASYRLLIRQAQTKPSHQVNQTMNQETVVENAFFAALLHLEGLGLMALQLSCSLDPKGSARAPPHTFLRLWRCVAELRRRIVTRRITIKNLEANATSSSSQQINNFVSRVIERCELMLLLAIDEDEEHAAYELDGGFVAPWNPATSFRSTSLTTFPKGDAIGHTATRYGALNAPFLVAFPDSPWRRVRTMFHVMTRWRRFASRNARPTPVIDAALEFVTRPDRGRLHDLQMIYTSLVDPLRRLACAARGFELLSDLLALPSLAFIQLSIVRQITDVFASRDATNTMRQDQYASFFFREHARGAHHEYLASVTSLMVSTAQATLQESSESSVTVSSAKWWSVLALLRPWCQPLQPDDLEMVCDIGIVSIVLQLAEKLGGRVGYVLPMALPQGDSIRSMALIASKTATALSTGDEVKARHAHVMQALVRFLCLQFAFHHHSPQATAQIVPVFPVAAAVFDALLGAASRLADRISFEHTPPKEPSEPKAAASNVTAPLRRSFELVIAPTVFSPFQRGITFRYSDMLDPPAHPTFPRQPMAPLVKPGEFTVTTWIFVDALSADVTDFDDRRIVFLRGSERELNPYLVLARDVDGNWHYEVGVAFAAGRSWVERLISKESVRTGSWTHVAIALEGAKMRLYINGVLDSQRTMAAPLVAACAASAVSLDFHFGRLSSLENSSVSAAGRLLSTLLIRQDGEKRSSVTLRSFRGLLSHFRFHNRALSPIHVRIVFDEKKPVDEDIGSASRSIVPSLSGDAEQFLQVLAALHILSSSAEGILHMSQPKWVVHVWRVVQQCSFPSLQRASIRLLGRLLPYIEPTTVAHSLIREGLLPEDESIDARLLFVFVLLRSIGLSVSTKSASGSSQQKPQLSLPDSLELQNAGAMRLLDDCRRRRDRTAFAIELHALMVRLCASSTSAWREAIWEVVGRVSGKGSCGAESLGAWFLLSGGTDLLFEGASVQLALTRERGVVVALESRVEPAKRPEPTEATPVRVFVCLDGAQRDDNGRDFDWHQSLNRECALLRSHYANLSSPSAVSPSRQFIKLCAQDIQPLAPSSLISCEIMPKLQQDSVISAAPSQLERPSICVQEGEEATCTTKTACDELDRLQCAGFVVKALADLATTRDGAKRILEHTAIVEQLMQIATRDDTLPAFHTLDSVEKKLWAARSRLQQLIGDLGDSGDEALRDWIKTRRAAHLSCVVDGTDSVNGKAGSLERGPEVVEEARASHFSRLLTLDLNIGVGAEEEEDLPSSRTGIGAVDSSRSARYRQSDAGIGDRILFSGSIADDDRRGGEEDDGDDDEDDEEEEEEEEDPDEEEDDDEEEDGDDNRQEYVDELMIMGFPEDWCVLALKQTENDIVAASAWIVDNLEYLSRMQISLDKQRDTSDNLGREDEEDDVDDAGDRESTQVEVPNHLESMVPMPQQEQESRATVGALPSRLDSATPLVNDKEMARKVFGEMYFPFDEGGHLSNTKESFLTAWQVRETKSDATPKPPEAMSSPSLETTTATPSIDRFQTDMETWEMEELLGAVSQLEHAFLTLSARVVLLRLLQHIHESGFSMELFDCTLSRSFTTLIKLIACRGDQFDRNYTDTAPSTTLRRALTSLLRHHSSALGSILLRFVLGELEVAATSTQYEASLWTQRELKRCDAAVLEEPGVELASWLLGVVFDVPSVAVVLFGTDVEPAYHPLLQLTNMLRSSNLPLKFLVLQTISQILQLYTEVSAHTDAVWTLLNQCHIDFSSVLQATNNRFARESVQQRVLFSQYLQVFVELLLILRRLEVDASKRCGLDHDVLRHAGPAMNKSMFTTTSPPVLQVSDGPLHDLALTFDRKKCRSTLLHITDDGLSVSYSGNEMWKMVLTNQSFSVGTHQWTIRIDKSTSSYLFIGVASRLANVDSFLGADEHSWGFIGDKALYYQRNRLRVYGDAFGEGDLLRVDLNCEQGTLAFSKNGVPLGIAFENIVGEVFPAVAFYSRHQKVTLLSAATSLPTPAPSPTAASLLGGSVEDCLLACFMMENIVNRAPISREVVSAAHTMSLDWLRGGLWHVFTREERSLWVDTRREACTPFGFQAKDRVRTPRGVGTVVGVADGRLWVEVDGERGAWFFHPSKLRSLALVVVTKEATQGKDASLPLVGDIETNGTFELTAVGGSTDVDGLSLTEDEFSEMLLDARWGLAMDRQLVGAINAHCESSSLSPWNLKPSQVLEVLKSRHALDPTETTARLLEMGERRILARFGFLRFLNAYLLRVMAFFDLTWHYFSPRSSLLPCQLISSCRGCIFTVIKNDLLSALMDRTANSPRKADDDYDYPDDLPQLLINRPKAATAKCHPGTVKSVLLSMTGQAFEELHFLPLRTLRMVYSHPMDDGQLRSFKVRFEGEGVDDYGGPYREFFSQFFAELQMVEGSSGFQDGDQRQEAASASESEAAKDGACFLPFLLPSPNWRNGVGSCRDKFVLNGGILGGSHVGDARVVRTANSHQPLGGQNSDVSLNWAESDEARRQLLSEMCHFLGQMIGICLRTRVCVRLDLATSVWKQLVGEEDATETNEEDALTALKEVDFVAYTLFKTVRALVDEYHQLDASAANRGQRRRKELEEELAAMDLTFTTYLSDGRLVELCPHGEDVVVTMENATSFLRRALSARTKECSDVVNIIKQGIYSVVPVTTLGLLTWEELEKRVCGVAEVDIELLKQNTEYDEDLSPNDEFIQRFWRVLAAMSDEDKRAFLRFVWARSRLPIGSAQFHQKFKIQSLAASASAADNNGSSVAPASASSGAADQQLPKSHTCFFALQLPRYSTDEICRKQLLYAIHNCVEMDGDFRLADTEMTGWTDIDPNDRLRF